MQFMGKAAPVLKNWGRASHPCSNMGPSNMLFRVTDSCNGHVNRT